MTFLLAVELKNLLFAFWLTKLQAFVIGPWFIMFTKGMSKDTSWLVLFTFFSVSVIEYFVHILIY